VLCTMVDVHNPKSQDQFYFCNVSSGGASTKVIGRSQTLSVEVGITTILTMTVYECPEPVFTPETGRCVGVLRIPVERMAERYSSGIFQQWFNLDTKTDPRAPVADHQKLATQFEEAYTNAVADVYQPKLCISVIGSAFEVERSGRHTCSIFVGEDVKTQAGPDLKALIASHKQQAAYIDALHEELRKATTPSYRPAAAKAPMPVPAPVVSTQIVHAAPMVHHTPVMSTMSTPVVAPVMYHSTPTAAPVHTQFFESAVKPFRAAPAVDSVPMMHSMPVDSIPMTGPVMHSMQGFSRQTTPQAGYADQSYGHPGIMSYEHPHHASMTPSMIAPVQ